MIPTEIQKGARGYKNANIEVVEFFLPSANSTISMYCFH